MTQPDADAAFAEGLAQHQAGRIEAARACYEAALRAEPNHFDALHMLAVAASQGVAWEEAVALYDRAIAADPDVAAAHSNRAAALQALGRSQASLESCDRAIGLAPSLAAAHVNRGNALLALARPLDALASYDRALGLGADDAETRYNRANALRDLARLDEAVAGYDQALARRSDYLEALCNRGGVLTTLGQLDAALASYAAAAAIAPDSAEVRLNRSAVLQRLFRLDAALADADAAIALAPAEARGHESRAAVLNLMHRPAEALAAADRALEQGGADRAEAHNNRGVALYDLRRTDEALDAYDRAVAARPAFAEARHNRALALLKTGDLLRGFTEYQWRWRLPDAADLPRRLGFQPWEGEDLAGRNIVVFSEQGLGDTLQFVRFVPRLVSMAARVTLLTEMPLVSLLDQVAGVAVTDRLTPGGTFDFQVALLCLPRMFATTLATIPGETPYLTADPAKTAGWSERLARAEGLRVGLVWAGASRAHDPAAAAVDRRRSLRLAELAPLAAVPGVSFHSLQVGPPAAEAAPAGLRIVDLSGQLSDFAETAAAVASLDLVITVDTSVAHLAGALGKPVWILSRFDGCWRWLGEREDSPWYPTARLFHQRAPGDWAEVVRRVADELAALAAGRRAT